MLSAPELRDGVRGDCRGAGCVEGFELIGVEWAAGPQIVLRDLAGSLCAQDDPRRRQRRAAGTAAADSARRDVVRPELGYGASDRSGRDGATDYLGTQAARGLAEWDGTRWTLPERTRFVEVYGNNGAGNAYGRPILAMGRTRRPFC